jgi:FlaA1/EpsC-like NDP-sugar epimerase
MRDKEHYEALYYALKDKYLEELGVYALDANLINLKEDIVWIDYIRHMDSETFLLKWYEDSGGKIITDILNKTPIRYGNTIVIYGAGIRGSYIFHALFAEQAFKIAAWVDKKSEELGYPISAPDCIDKLSFDYVLVAIESVNTYRAVKNYLLSKGIDEKKICWIG